MRKILIIAAVLLLAGCGPAKMIPVEEHDFYLVTFVDGHQTNKQQKDSTKPSSKFNCIHQL